MDKSTTETCFLPNGMPIRFRIGKRSGSEVYYVYFGSPTGQRVERSTKATNRKAAITTATALILSEYQPELCQPEMVNGIFGWSEVKTRLEKAMKADNLRPGTIYDYITILISLLQRSFPTVRGPAEITAAMAQKWKESRSQEVVPETLNSDLIALGSLYRKWLMRKCGIVTTNPFEYIGLPKLDKRDPRVLAESEEADFLNWLRQEWSDWRLPILFLEVKGWVGPRIGELAGLPTANLVEGRIKFDGDKVKGRNDGYATLPKSLYEELRSIAGPTFVFESYSDELRTILSQRENTRNFVVKPFRPDRLVAWMQKQLDRYRKSRGIVKGDPRYFKLHNFRGTAMTRAQDAGVSLDDASEFFRCHPDTIRRHYSKRNKQKIADDVAKKIEAMRAKTEAKGGDSTEGETAA